MPSMNREKHLVKSTGIIAIGQLSSKIFTFLLLPLYTAKLSPSDYGTVDLLQTVISLLMYFMTLQLEAAVFRFLIESRGNKEQETGYIVTCFFALIVTSGTFTVALTLINIFRKIPFVHLLILCLWTQAFSYLMQNISRGFGHNGIYSLSSFITTVVSLAINLVLILQFDIGAVSILYAQAFSSLGCGTFILIREKMWKFLSIKDISSEKLREMLHYSLPLIPNAMSWWIANTSDRLLIAFFLGTSFNGIYAAANKIPTIYTTIFNVYNLAWIESVSMAMKDTDRDHYIEKMMNQSYKFFSFLNLGIISSMSILFNVLIGSNYNSAYPHVYILLVSIFFNSMCSLYGGILTGFKDSKTIGLTTIAGAVVNFIINICLIRFVGLFAASLSTLASYLIIMIIRAKECHKYVDFRISSSYFLQLIIALLVVSVGYFSRTLLINIIILILLTMWGIVNNRDSLKGLGTFVRKK